MNSSPKDVNEIDKISVRSPSLENQLKRVQLCSSRVNQILVLQILANHVNIRPENSVNCNFGEDFVNID